MSYCDFQIKKSSGKDPAGQVCLPAEQVASPLGTVGCPLPSVPNGTQGTSRVAARSESCAMLDIPTPPNAYGLRALSRRLLGKSSRRLYSRLILGLAIPGRYYFCTWTTTKDHPLTEKDWRNLSLWLHRQRPLAVWCYVITREGNGVIHLVLRLGKGEKRLDAKETRAYWTALTGARQIKLVFVSEPLDLASYLADQRRKKTLSGEFAWQDDMVRWRWSKGWLPKGFTRAFGRVWYRLLSAPPHIRENVVKTWLLRCNLDLDNIKNPPKIILTDVKHDAKNEI